MAIDFQVERMRAVIDEIRPLHVAHWNELPHLRPEGDLDPDYERFFALEEAGSALLATARRDHRLIGYSTFYMNRDLWTAQRYASGDLLYLVPSERGGWAAVRLFEYAHAALKHVGIRDVRGFAAEGNRIASLMRYVGYQPTDKQQYVRAL